MHKLLAAFLFIFTTAGVRAQSWEIGGFAGGAGYMGDLNLNNPLKVSGGSVGAFVQRNFNGYLSAKLQYTYGSISGADSTSSNQQFRNRNLSFATQLSEFSLIGEFNFMRYIASVTDNRFTPFFYMGFGLLNYNPQAVYDGKTYNLRPLETEGESKPYAKTAFSIPYGAGFKYNFSGACTVAFDIGYRNPNTNYLDDVSGYYPNKSKLPNALSVALSDRSGEKTGNYIGAAGSQRGEGRTGDTYFFVGISISYTFITTKCFY